MSGNHQLHCDIGLWQRLLPSLHQGVWATETIKSGLKYGPFTGEVITEATDDMDPAYVWEVSVFVQNVLVHGEDHEDRDFCYIV